eukprot:1756536-Pyramimonas_sp.AAC.1
MQKRMAALEKDVKEVGQGQILDPEDPRHAVRGPGAAGHEDGGAREKEAHGGASQDLQGGACPRGRRERTEGHVRAHGGIRAPDDHRLGDGGARGAARGPWRS